MKLSRRNLLKWSAAAGAGGFAARCGTNNNNADGGIDAMDASADAGSDADASMMDSGPSDGGTVQARVVIIGSGFGGSVTALRLAQAGIPSIVLERGKRWPITADYNTFSHLLFADRRSTWLSEQTVLPFGPVTTISRYIGVLERVNGNGMNLYHGAGVGGGSLVYGGFAVTPDEMPFTRVFPAALPYAEMRDVYYPRARAMLRATPIPADVFAYSGYDSDRVFRAQAMRAGVNYRQVDLAVDWDIVRQEIAGTVPASAINGEVIYGNDSGCKISLDRTYLADAEATGHCQIMPQHLARDITTTSSGGYQVLVDQIDESGHVVARKTFVCDYLFVSAGCNGTNNLFVKAKAKGLLPNLDNHVGQNFGNNGNAMFMRWNVGTTTGARQSSFGGQAMADFTNPVSPALIEHAQFPSGMDCTCLLQLGMCLDVGRGSFRYDPTTDTAVLDWPANGDDIPVMAMQNLADRLNMANGGSLMGSQLGIAVNGILSNFTYHPLGGMVIGDATDMYGRVNNYARLYAMDGSLLPRTAGGVNPALTITALAERCIERILMEDFRDA
jgi:cholesterol oxidase